MRFREEMFRRILTFITVAVLFGIVVFEAISLQGTRNARAEAEKMVLELQEDLQTLSQSNEALRQEKEELTAFWEEWSPYAAFTESKEVLTLQSDLFQRPEMIPDEVREAVLSKLEEETRQDLQNPSKEEEELSFSFSDPGQDSVFLPLRTGGSDQDGCLVYTVAREENHGMPVELLFEVDFTVSGSVIDRDENGKIKWNCVAYDMGDGWQGIGPETDGQKQED